MAGIKALMLLGPNVFAAPFLRDFRESPQKFEDSESTEQNATEEPKVMKERGDTELSTPFLGKIC